MDIFLRVFLTVVGIVLAGLALWGADEMRYGNEVALVISSLTATVVGACACYKFVVNFIDAVSFNKTFDGGGIAVNVSCEVEDALYAAVVLVCVAFLFGWLADEWMTPWLSLLVIGALPMILVVKSIVIDIILTKYAKTIIGGG